MNKFCIEACYFPGFYESVLESSDSIYYETEEYINNIKENHPKFEGDTDDVEVDYKGYEREIAEVWVRGYSSYMPKHIVVACEFDSIVPPRNTGYGPDYRFGTDKVYINVTLEENWLDSLKAFIEENKEWFKNRILDDWSSYDGFTSFMSNDVDVWIRGLEEEDERYIGTTLAYMAYKEHGDFYEDLNMEALETVSLWSFLSLSEEKTKELDEIRDAEDEEQHIREYDEKHQLKIDFDGA